MLVLSRKPGEAIYIGDDIVVKIVEVSGRLTRIGIEAPRSITVLRAEVKRQIEEENILAAAKGGYIDRLKDLGSLFSSRLKKNS